jgi:hypothetical protein
MARRERKGWEKEGWTSLSCAPERARTFLPQLRERERGVKG